jgi:parallel beta-helix repeat protein
MNIRISSGIRMLTHKTIVKSKTTFLILLSVGLVLATVGVFFRPLHALFPLRVGISQDPMTYTVGPPGSGADYTKIQDAINAASDGDTVIVWNWMYVENVVVDKSLNIIGTSPNSTIVSASLSSQDVFLITASNVQLTGFKIMGADLASAVHISGGHSSNVSTNIIENNKIGVYLSDSDGNSIYDNVIASNKDKGIHMDNSNSNIFSRNNVSKNEIGMVMVGSSDNLVQENTVSSNPGSGIHANFGSNDNRFSGNSIENNGLDKGWDGIAISYSNNNTISGNNVVHNKNIGILVIYGCFNKVVGNTLVQNNGGIILGGNSSVVQSNKVMSTGYTGIDVGGYNNEVSSNYVWSTGDRSQWYGTGIEAEGTNNRFFNNTVLSSGRDGISFGDTGNTISGNNVSLNQRGIVSWFQVNAISNLISNNVVKYNGVGIGLYISIDEPRQNNTILENDVSSNGVGISLNGASVKFNNIVGNNITNNDSTGIFIDESDSNTFSKNNVTKNNVGIEVATSRNNTISKNNLMQNRIGIFLTASSTYNTIYSNIVSSNLDFGICINQTSHLNWIYNNYFSNTANAWDDGYNYWNLYPKTLGMNILRGPFLGGNYWNDYLGSDIDTDGIGDTDIPYNSQGNIKNQGDRLPLVPTVSYVHIGDIVDIKSRYHPILAATNSAIPLESFVSNETTFSFNITNTSNAGYCSLMVEMGINGSAYLIYVDSHEVDYKAANNGTHYFLYFTFSQGFHNILVTTVGSVPWISEFPVDLILPFFMILTLVTVILGKRIKTSYKIGTLTPKQTILPST